MKKIITLSILTTGLISYSTSAQIKKAEKMLGGNLGITQQKNVSGEYSSASTSIYLSPKLGFGLAGNWIVGFSAGFNYGKQENKTSLSSDKGQSHSYQPGLFVRKFHSFQNIFGIFGEAGLNYGFGKTTTTNQASGITSKSKSEQHDYAISIKPGVYFKPNRKIFVEATVGSI